MENTQSLPHGNRLDIRERNHTPSLPQCDWSNSFILSQSCEWLMVFSVQEGTIGYCINIEGLYLITHISIWERDSDIISDQSLWVIRFASKRCIKSHSGLSFQMLCLLMCAGTNRDEQHFHTAKSFSSRVQTLLAKPIKPSFGDWEWGMALRLARELCGSSSWWMFFFFFFLLRK